MTTTTMKAPARACHLVDRDGIQFELLADAGGDVQVKREWKMLAHTGQIVSRWWGRLVLDMDGAKFAQKLALLKDHRTDQPIGYSTKVGRTDKGIEASGKLLSNPIADEVLSASREGFPWQASLMAVPTRTEEVMQGAKSKVNGREVEGPLTIFREFTVHELTLTVLGADSNTTTEAFAAEGGVEYQQMTTKIDPAPAKQPVDLAPQVPAPQDKHQPDPKGDPSLLESQRAAAILQAAEPDQMQLAAQLVKDRVPLHEAVQKLHEDNRSKLRALREQLKVGAEPIGGGNTAKHVEAAGSGVNFAALESAPHDAESLKAEWVRNDKLRTFFENDRVFLAWHKNRNRMIHLGTGKLDAEMLAGGLKSLGFRNIQGRYFLSYEDALGASWATRIVTEIPTDQAQEVHKWLGTPPNPVKWTGERQRTRLTDYGITVVGEKFESTVDVDIDDLRRDKTGQILNRIGEMGAKMATLPQRLITQLIESSGLAYDGLSIWNTAHLIGKTGATQSNDITVSGLATPDAPSSAGMAGAILSGVQQLAGLRDDRNDPMNDGATRFLLLVPTKYMQVTLAALRNEFTSAGVSNTILNTGLTITPIVNARLNGAAAAGGRRIYLFREDAAVRSLIWQEEEIPDAFKSQDAYSESGFWRDSVAWGAKRISAVAPGRIELACRINLAA
jgi:phage major head subunit gpT-like protein